ncbi:MAG TPA: lipase family protein [Solirubrobacterales bacterium]|nr:lipase family protein [Solirubrobacterales bacterium]
MTGFLRRMTCGVVLLAVALAMLVIVAPVAQAAPPTPEEDPFYQYTGTKPLSEIAPGTVLKTRTLSYHVVGLPTAVPAIQLLYRANNELGEPTVNVTSVLKPLLTIGTPQVVAYQSFYDSLNPVDEPSYAISGGLTLGGAIPQVESSLIGSSLLAGRTVVIADTEGETADFAAGPEYGTNTLDSLKAAIASPATGLSSTKKIAMIGYSGGAIATEWAAELAPTYAPTINSKLVGATMGGVLVDPAHNLHYVDGSLSWAGVMPMAIIGVSRAFHIDLTPYLSAYGKQVYAKLEKASIANVLAQYPGLTWTELAKPEYATPESIPVYVHTVNQLIMGTRGTPTTPLQISQGALGELEGTLGNKPGIGEGDGVMIAGDVRTLARQYCGKGTKVSYTQYALGHIGTAVPWIAEAMAWMNNRFLGFPAPSNCSSIEPGNSLAPIAE